MIREIVGNCNTICGYSGEAPPGETAGSRGKGFFSYHRPWYTADSEKFGFFSHRLRRNITKIWCRGDLRSAQSADSEAAAAVERAVSIILDSTTVFTVAAAIVISSMAITPVVLAELVVVNFRQTDLHLD